MTRLAIFRPATAQAASDPAAATRGSSALPEPRDRPRWRWRPHALVMPRRSLPEIQHEVLERVLDVLEAARADLSAGWVQDGWWATEAGGGRRILVTGLAAGASGPREADGVCLVGSLVRAGAAQGGDSEAGRAIDAVYEALWESHGQPAADGMLPVSSPEVRQARVQALTHWNDAPDRTGGEVLAILDRAIARVIQALAALPAPRAAAGSPAVGVQSGR